MEQPKLFLVIPCYNEEETLDYTNTKLLDKLSGLIQQHMVSDDSKIVYVNDGSKDGTLDIAKRFSEIDKHVAVVNLSRNRGHQNALLGGLMCVKDLCDVTISLDADLQDDINCIDGMLKEYKNGSEIVYGVRNDRASDTFFKKATAEGFYKLLAAFGVETVFNHADYRLMSAKALNALAEYKETNLYLRGIIPQLGFKTSEVYYARHERVFGTSKYNIKKMLALALNGITSFSVKPLSIAAVLFILFFIAAAASGICSAVFRNIYLCLISIMLFCTSAVMAVAAVISIYIGKIMLEIKHRPRYIIENTYGLENDYVQND